MMNKYLFIGLSTLTLAACGGGDSSETTINLTPGLDADSVSDVEVSRIAFDPSAAEPVLPLPSDLLYSGTTDGTLEPPDEADAKEAGEAVDMANPGASLGGNDGWSTQMPMQISVDLAEGATLDVATVGPTTVLLVETDCGLALTDCTTFTPVTYGDYVGVGDESGTITVVPLVPLNPKTNYLLALTNGILDSRGEAVGQSLLYEQVTVDPSELDIQGDLGPLQDAINGYEQLLSLATGTATEDMIYTASWTTTSAGDAVGSTAQAVTTGFNPTVTGVAPHGTYTTTADYNPLLAGIADVYEATITLPYFLASPSVEDPTAPLTERFQALCDNGVLLSQTDPAVLATLTPGANAASCAALGLGDFGLDTERYVTRYNPVAEYRTIEVLEVIITVPNALSGQTGPFPLVMYQHGITSNKETVMAFADTMALAGYATIAIDLPLHGSRGFDLDGDASNGDEINASTVDVQHYMNLGYLQTGKDNLRQSFLDMLGLRMAIANNEFTFDGSATITDADFDRASLDFVGMSLGGMTGTAFAAVAASLGMPVDSASLIVPGGGILPLLLSSESFGSVVQTAVLTGAGLDPATTDEATATAVLSEFGFAAQAIIDAGDPNNYAAGLAASGTPIYMSQVNGDAVIPNQSAFAGLTFGGTEPLASLMGLTQISFGDTPSASGFVKFTEGSHGTFLDPTASVNATTEMQTQVATFIAGGVVAVTDAGVVE